MTEGWEKMLEPTLEPSHRVPDYLLRDCITVIQDAYLTEDGGNGDDAIAVLECLYALFGETIPPCSCGNPNCDGH